MKPEGSSALAAGGPWGRGGYSVGSWCAVLPSVSLVCRLCVDLICDADGLLCVACGGGGWVEGEGSRAVIRGATRCCILNCCACTLRPDWTVVLRAVTFFFFLLICDSRFHAEAVLLNAGLLFI